VLIWPDALSRGARHDPAASCAGAAQLAPLQLFRINSCQLPQTDTKDTKRPLDLPALLCYLGSELVSKFIRNVDRNSVCPLSTTYRT
jgi:hypothetical protein